MEYGRFKLGMGEASPPRPISSTTCGQDPDNVD